jgi:hypothetical protein
MIFATQLYEIYKASPHFEKRVLTINTVEFDVTKTTGAAISLN